MKSEEKYKRGFSLIELMVVMAIIAIGASLTWSNIASGRRQQIVDSACENVAARVSKVRAQASEGASGGGVDGVGITCSGAICQIQNRSTQTGGWSAVPGGDYVLEGSNIESFTAQYSVPYAAEISLTNPTPAVTFPSDTSIKKTLHIDRFRASCQ